MSFTRFFQLLLCLTSIQTLAATDDALNNFIQAAGLPETQLVDFNDSQKTEKALQDLTDKVANFSKNSPIVGRFSAETDEKYRNFDQRYFCAIDIHKLDDETVSVEGQRLFLIPIAGKTEAHLAQTIEVLNRYTLETSSHSIAEFENIIYKYNTTPLTVYSSKRAPTGDITQLDSNQLYRIKNCFTAPFLPWRCNTDNVLNLRATNGAQLSLKKLANLDTVPDPATVVKKDKRINRQTKNSSLDVVSPVQDKFLILYSHGVETYVGKESKNTLKYANDIREGFCRDGRRLADKLSLPQNFEKWSYLNSLP